MTSQTRNQIQLGNGASFKVPPDNGCWVHPHCLECPRERCIHDEPSNHPPSHDFLSLEERRKRNAKVLDLHHAHIKNAQIARQLNMRPQTVGKIISRAMKESAQKGGDTSALQLPASI